MVFKNITNPEGKTTKELLEEMFAIPGLLGSHPESCKARSDALEMAIRAKIWDQQSDTIKERTEDFIDESKTLRGAIDKFRESVEGSSHRLNWLTFVIAAAAVVQVGIFIYGIICPR